jgi:hypothetical protein
MSNDRGFIALHRKIFENPIIGSNPAYFRAWVWLLCEAKYKPTSYRIPGKSAAIFLQRGQLSHARSFIAKALDLSEQRVRTFLNRLKIEGMILVDINQGQMVITMCNYEDYQLDANETNQQSNPQISQQLTSHQPELNKGNKEIKDFRLAESEIPRPAAPPKPKRHTKLEAAPAGSTPEFDALRSQFIAYAAKKNLAACVAADEFEGFLSHHKARGNLFADWHAAGQGWIRNTVKFAAQRSGHQPGRRPDL